MVRYWMSLWLGVVGAIGFSGSGAIAQSVIVPDGTLGSERSIVLDNYNGNPTEVIGGGARRVQNIFHSFAQFNVSEGRSAYFFVPDNAVRNVLTRVTGVNASEILGRLGTFQVVNNQFAPSNANFFLVNPNGVIFGPRSSLDIGGSVVVTTANALQFPNGDLFSATAPTIPSSVLTVDPSALLYNAINAQNQGIVVQSAFNDPNNLIGRTIGLQVRDNKSLSLFGGDINIDGGQLNASSGRIQLSGLAENGIFKLNVSNNDLKFDFPISLKFSSIFLTNATKINLSGNGRGIDINGQDINILNNSSIFTNILQPITGIDSKQIGDINIHAKGLINLTQASIIGSIQFGTGRGSNINVSGGNVFISKASQISSVGLGNGNAGNVTIQADEKISFLGRGDNGNPAAILTSVFALKSQDNPDFSGNGNGGNVNLKAKLISLEDGALISTTVAGTSEGRSGNINVNVSDSLLTKDGSIFSTATLGSGDSGSITIEAGNLVRLEGINSNGSRGGLSSKVNAVTGVIKNRRGGDIILKIGSLDISNGANIESGSYSVGDSGKISIEAKESILLANNGFILSNIEAGGVGNAGDIDITANSIILKGVSQIQSMLKDADSKNNLAGGKGRAGNIKIKVTNDFTIVGRDDSSTSSSAIFSSARSGTEGDSGNIDISAGSILMKEDGSIFSNTFGSGSGGNILIKTNNLILNSGGQISGGSGRENIPGQFGRGGNISIIAKGVIAIDNVGGVINRSGIFTETSSSSYAGDIDITTKGLMISNGSAISSGGSGSGSSGGNGGNLTVNASEYIEIFGSTKLRDGSLGRDSVLTTEASGIGNAGQLKITTDQLRLRDRGSIVSATYGKGDAGTPVKVNI